jgi:hypothetical protein
MDYGMVSGEAGGIGGGNVIGLTQSGTMQGA